MPEALLAEFYKKKLLEPGWAGELNADELAYIKGRLMNDRRLRAKWGFKRGTGRLSEERIRMVAMDGVEALQNRSKSEPEAPVQLRFHDERGYT